MRLSSVLERISDKEIGRDVDIGGIAYDSRAVKVGDAFFAIVGTAMDGRDFIPDAIERGASAVVTEGGEPLHLAGDVAVATVPDARAALSSASDLFFGQPSKRLLVSGVTGTKGKTTTCHLIKSVLDAAGEKTSLMGTLHNIVGDEERPAYRTTSESKDLHSIMKEMVDAGSTAVTMEVSSHALVLKRVEDIEFKVATLTNIGHDHLDFHGTVEAYAAAKRRLFEILAPGGVSTLNADEPYFGFFRSACHNPVVTYGLDRKADVSAERLRMDGNGSSFTLRLEGQREKVTIQLPGRFNLYNALAAASVGYGLRYDIAAIAAGLRAAPRVRGRLEVVEGPGDFHVWVDYAHNPESLESVLGLAREVAKARVIVVFGCGGDRDAIKRPVMGRIAGDIADYVVLTDDNPRSEDEDKILDQVEKGLRSSANATCFSRRKDRREAIRLAVSLAGKDDIIVVAGKGHETYQEFKDVTVDFDDAAVAKEAMVDRARGVKS